MATIVWPATLPQRVQRDGARMDKGDVRMQSPMEAGNSRSRAQRTYVLAPIQARMILTDAQLDIFDGFWDSIGKGVMPFLFPAISGGGTWAMKWGQNPPASEPHGVTGEWVLSLDLVRLP